MAAGFVSYSGDRSWVSSAMQLLLWVFAALSLASPFIVELKHVRKCAAYAVGAGVVLVLIATKNPAIVLIADPLAIYLCSNIDTENIYFPSEILSFIIQFHFAFFVGCVAGLMSCWVVNRTENRPGITK